MVPMVTADKLVLPVWSCSGMMCVGQALSVKKRIKLQQVDRLIVLKRQKVIPVSGGVALPVSFFWSSLWFRRTKLEIVSVCVRET